MHVFSLLGICVLGVSLSGCAAPVALTPAPDANNPVCAEVMVRLPETISNLPRRETNAQSTSAWNTPASILLYCGVEVPSASSYTCVEVDGLFWLRNDEAAPSYTFRLYGREPALDVVVDSRTANGFAALSALSRAASLTKENGRSCVGIEDSTLTNQTQIR